MSTALAQLVKDKLTQDHKSYRELGAEIGVANGTIGRIVNSKPVDLSTLDKVADYFHLNREDVYRMASHEPSPAAPAVTESPEEAKRQLRIKQLLNVISRLPEEDQAEITSMAMTMAGLSDKNRALLLSMAKTMLEQEVA